MGVQYTTRTIDEWLSMIRSSKVALPDFQRSYVWKSDKKATLMEAILSGRPVGMLMVLECEEGKPNIQSRDFAKSNRAWEPGKVCEQVLDGQQRLTSIREMLEEPGYYISLTGVDRFEDEDDDYCPDSIEIDSVEHYPTNKNPGKKYKREPREALAAGLIPVDILGTKQLGPQDDSWKTDKILSWCQNACSEKDNDYCQKLHRYIESYLYTPLLQYSLHQCVLPKNIPTGRAIEIFIGTNKNATMVTEFDIVAAHADGKYGLKVRENIAAFCKSCDCKHIRSYFGEKEEEWVPAVGTWMLKVACLKAKKDGVAPDGVAPKINLYFTAFNNFISNQKDTHSKATKKSTQPSKGAIKVHAEERLTVLLKGLDGALQFVFKNGIPSKKGINNWPAIHVIAALQEVESEIHDPECRGFADRFLTMYFWRTFFTERYQRQANDRLLEDFQAMKICMEEAASGNVDPDTSKCRFFDPKYGSLDEGDLAKELKNLNDPWPWLYQGRKGCAVAAVMRKNAATDWVSGECINGMAIRMLEEKIQELGPKEKKLKRLDCHHVFPKGFIETKLRKAGLPQKLIEHGMNGTFLLNGSNIRISDKDPARYIKDLVGEKKNTRTGVVALKKRLREQHILYADIAKDQSIDAVKRYKLFIEGRANLLAKEISQLVRQKGQ